MTFSAAGLFLDRMGATGAVDTDTTCVSGALISAFPERAGAGRLTALAVSVVCARRGPGSLARAVVGMPGEAELLSSAGLEESVVSRVRKFSSTEFEESAGLRILEGRSL